MPTAPTVVTGNRTTVTGIQQARRVVEMLDRIYDYDGADHAPFLTILSKRAPAQVAVNPKFQHLEDQPLPTWTTLNGSITATATTINVAAGTGVYFRAGDVAVMPAAGGFSSPGEMIKVTSVATDALTVVRNYDGDQVNGGATSSGANISIIGNVNQEYATSRTILSTTEAVQTNYCQIIRTPFSASRTLQGSKLYGGDERTRSRAKNALQHAMECERSFLFGKKYDDGAGTRATGGILQWIQTNQVNANGTLTANTLETFFEKIFRYGGQTKLGLCSRRVASQIDLIAEGRLITQTGADTYGVKVKEYQTVHGMMMLCTHDMLINDYAGYLIAIDLENVKKRFIQDDEGARDGMLVMNTQSPDADGWRDEYKSEIGLHVILEASHGVLTGVS